MLKRVKGVDGVLCLLSDKIDEELMDVAGPKLKVISNYAVGFDNINVDAATSRKIAVGEYAGGFDRRYGRPGIRFNARSHPAHRRRGSIRSGAEIGKPGAPRFCWEKVYAEPRWVWSALAGLARQWPGAQQGFDMRVIYYNRTPLDKTASVPGTWVDLDTLLKESGFHLAARFLERRNPPSD